MSVSLTISVVTPSIRHEGLLLCEKALKRQTEKRFEWIIGSPTEPQGLSIPFVWVKDPPKNPGDYWATYKSYNAMVKEVHSDLVISLQDWTYFDPEVLEKFWFHHKQEPKTIVTGVGNKYQDDSWTVTTWQDPRIRTDQGTYYPCYFNDIELNLASFPKEAFYAVGGFDESLDAWSSACGIDILARLNILGTWDFKLDQTIKSYSLEHGRLPLWEENNPFKNGVWEEKLRAYQKNPVLNYL